MTTPLYGLLAEFSGPEALLEAVRGAREAGFTRFETFAPCPVEGLEDYVLPKGSSIPGTMLAGGAMGAAGGFVLQWYAARDFPLDVGGRPLFSWPAFIPVTFELGILTAVFVGIISFLIRAGLPRYHHPVFAVTRFARASTDGFFLCLLADDPRFSTAAVKAVLQPLKPDSLVEVPA
jgi:hypothetical protein